MSDLSLILCIYGIFCCVKTRIDPSFLKMRTTFRHCVANILEKLDFHPFLNKWNRRSIFTMASAVHSFDFHLSLCRINENVTSALDGSS